MSNWHATKLSKALSIVLLVAVLGAIVAFVYVVSGEAGEAFTEFYILNSRGEATDYPVDLRAGEPADVILGMVNQEQETASYNVEIKVDGVKMGELGPIILEHNSRTEQPVTFTAARPGKHQKVEFLLYKQGQAEVYKSLYLWVDVIR